MSEVQLRPFTRDEYHAFFRDYVSDPLMDPNPYHYQFTHVDRSFDFDQFRWSWYPNFGIFVDDVPVGILSLKRIDPEKKQCEIGLILQSDEVKNRGYGTAAMRLGMQKAVSEYGIVRIWADTMGRNHRMQHILDKLGFRLVERIAGVYDMPDGKEDRLNYLWEADK